MYEKCNPAHSDKIADRIAGAIVDYAFNKDENSKVAVEVLIGHNECSVMIESDFDYTENIVSEIVSRIITDAGERFAIYMLNIKIVKQDKILNENKGFGDNGIFKGMPTTNEQKELTDLASQLYNQYRYDGKYFCNGNELVICHSNTTRQEIREIANDFLRTMQDKTLANELLWDFVIINPLGEWTGGLDVDSGATNRKLGSDMGDAITGGGLHGKDISKADVTANILCHLIAQWKNTETTASTHIGQNHIDIFYGDNEYIEYTYEQAVEIAKRYIKAIGGFEKFAEWGLIRPHEVDVKAILEGK